MPQLSESGGAIIAALSSRVGAARLSSGAIHGLGSAASLDAGVAAGAVPVLGIDGKLDADVIPDDLVGGAVDPAVLAGLEPRPTLADWATSARDLAVTDDRAILRVTHATPVLTIRAQADVAYPVAMVVSGTSVNELTITPSAGVTINGASAPVTVPRESSGGRFSITRRGTDAWVVAGAGGSLAADLAAAAAATAAHATHGPALGAANAAADLAQDKAALLAQFNAWLAKNEMVGFVAPYGGAGFPSLDEGDVLTVGGAVASHVRGVSTVSVEDLDQEPDAFAITNAGGLVEYNSVAAAWPKMQQGRPYASRTVELVSNVLAFDARAGRKVVTGQLTANSTIAASCWDYIGDHEEPVQVLVPIGATPYTLTGAPGDDGMMAFEVPAFAANTFQLLELSRWNGVPSLRWLDAAERAVAVAANPTFIDSNFISSINSANPWTLALPPGTQAGDSIIVFQANANSSSLPAIAQINGANLTDSGRGGDANAPAVRICWKENLTPAEIAAGQIGAASGSFQVAIATVRKTGSSPTFALPTYAKSAASATTTINWEAQAFTQNCLQFGFYQCLSTDTMPLRPGLTSIEGRGPSSACALGVSNLLTHGVDTIGAVTTTKTGGAGRVVTAQVVAY